MKRYRPTREVLAEVDKVLAGRASACAPLSLLDETVDLLYHARHYGWIGIYLNAGEQQVRQAFRGRERVPPCSAIAVPIRIGSRVLGVMDVESDRENAFGKVDRVFLEEVARRLARYLTTRGKHVLRRLRDQTQPAADAAEAAVDSPIGVRRAPVVGAKKSVRPSSKPSGRAGLRPASGVTSG
ncbi:MAG: GAF domain-containing protein [Burkholderiales bacterium]